MLMFYFLRPSLQRYRNYLSVIYLLKLKVQVITSIHWFTALWQSSTSISKLVEMFICQIFLMDYSIWVAKFWGKIYQKLSNNSELKTWQGRKYRILNLPRAFKDTQSSKLLFKVSPPHIILVSSWFVLCPENWVAERTPTQRYSLWCYLHLRWRLLLIPAELQIEFRAGFWNSFRL